MEEKIFKIVRAEWKTFLLKNKSAVWFLFKDSADNEWRVSSPLQPANPLVFTLETTDYSSKIKDEQISLAFENSVDHPAIKLSMSKQFEGSVFDKKFLKPLMLQLAAMLKKTAKKHVSSKNTEQGFTLNREIIVEAFSDMNDNRDKHDLFVKCAMDLKYGVFSKLFNDLPVTIKSPKKSGQENLTSDILKAKQTYPDFNDQSGVYEQRFKVLYTFNKSNVQAVHYNIDVVYHTDTGLVEISEEYPVNCDKALEETFRKATKQVVSGVEKSLKIKVSFDAKTSKVHSNFYPHMIEFWKGKFGI